MSATELRGYGDACLRCGTAQYKPGLIRTSSTQSELCGSIETDFARQPSVQRTTNQLEQIGGLKMLIFLQTRTWHNKNDQLVLLTYDCETRFYQQSQKNGSALDPHHSCDKGSKRTRCNRHRTRPRILPDVGSNPQISRSCFLHVPSAWLG